jgi:predicted nucleotidyltransferase
VSVGILNRKREGKHVYFKADTESPIFSELRGLILKTAGLVDVIRRCLKPFEKEIKIAFIYGSVARAEERSLSDIDLLLIGKVLLSDISPSFRKIEEIVGREVNGSVLSPLEFHGKLKRKNNFVMNIMKSKKIFISGDENDLAKMAG